MRDHLSPFPLLPWPPLRAHQLTHRQHSVLTVLLWGGLRRHGQGIGKLMLAGWLERSGRAMLT